MIINEIQDEIVDEFARFNNWLDKHNYLIKLGKDLPSMDEQYKTEKNLIKGCLVKTWFYSEFRDGKVFYYMDSESILTKGFIALLLRIFSGQKPEDIERADLYFIDKIGLKEHFSPFRANSLFKLVNKIKSEANLYKINKSK